MRRDYKIIIIIFILAIAIHAAVLLSFHQGEKSLLYQDSYTYVQIAKNIIEHRTYSMGYDVPPQPDNFRVPLYPLFLVPFVYANISYYIPVFFQIAMMGIAALMGYFLGRKLFPERYALIAAIVFALEPYSALITSQLMAEPLFVLFFIPAIFYMAFFVNSKESKYLLMGAVFLSLSSLTRPIAFWLFMLFPVAAFLAYGSLRQMSWKPITISVLIFFAVLAPWFLYNAVTLRTLEFSSQLGFALYVYHAPYFRDWLIARGEEALVREHPLPEFNAIIDSINLRYDLTQISIVKNAAIQFIVQHPVRYVLFHVSRTPLLFTQSAYGNIFYAIPGLQFDYDTEHMLYENIQNFRLREATKIISQKPIFGFLLFANLLFMVLGLLAVLNPIFVMMKEKRWNRVNIFFVFTIIMYALLTSPIAGFRYRIPLYPILFLLALESIGLLWHVFYSRIFHANRLIVDKI